MPGLTYPIGGLKIDVWVADQVWSICLCLCCVDVVVGHNWISPLPDISPLCVVMGPVMKATLAMFYQGQGQV